VTFYESNREVRPAGAEVEEFSSEPEPVPAEPPVRHPDDDRDGAEAGSGDGSKD